ncbi:MAG: hypothetical protein GY703_18875 [Gammaproteobacteria bacterium]|nr:hypothetical protein [Gammaproteobacteria bacterium]
MGRKITWFFIVFMITAGFSAVNLAAGSGSPEAVTAADPDIRLDELSLRLTPLTREELKVEAEAWLKLLQAKATVISTAEIAVKYRQGGTLQGRGYQRRAQRCGRGEGNTGRGNRRR